MAHPMNIVAASMPVRGSSESIVLAGVKCLYDISNGLMDMLNNCIAGLWISCSDRLKFEGIVIFDHLGKLCHEFSALVGG